MARYIGYVDIPHSTYDEWRNATNGNGYDFDNLYGFQCMDLAMEFWANVGFPHTQFSTEYPKTNTGNADGVWNRRIENLSYLGTYYFELVNNLDDVKRGDIICYSISPFGHIGFADEDYAAWHALNPTSYEFPILSENNGGTPDPYGKAGSYTNVHGYDTRYFQGAFRYIPWKQQPTPTERKHKFPWFIYSGEWKRRNNNYGII